MKQSSEKEIGYVGKDPLHLGIPEAAPIKMLIDGVTSTVRNALFYAGFQLAHIDVQYVHPDGELLQQVASLVEAGYVRPTVNQVFPLEQAAKAYEMLKSGHTRGKIVLTVKENK